MNYSYLKFTLSLRKAGLRRGAARLRLAARHRDARQNCSRNASRPTAATKWRSSATAWVASSRAPRSRMPPANGSRSSIMLGTPNAGSLAAVQALRGTYSVVRKIAMLDLRHDAEYLARNVFASFPGLHELLPANKSVSDLDLFDAAAWPAKGPGRTPRCFARRRGSSSAWRPPTRASTWWSAATAPPPRASRCAMATSSTNTACRATAPCPSSSRGSPAHATATWNAGTAT